MTGFIDLLRRNPNYRNIWLGQIVSEVGDHFNNIAVFSLAMHYTGSGIVVTGVMLSRAVPMLIAGPVAGVLLDRMNRKSLMVASDLVRALFALLFIFALQPSRLFPDPTWLLYILSALLMFASPFFTSGRGAILPSIVAKEDLHTANSLTQTTQWTTTAVGAFLGGVSAARFGYEWAFIINSLSFLVSAFAVSLLRAPKGASFRAVRLEHAPARHPWADYAQGLRYMRSVPLVAAIALMHVGWATGGGAAQILFSLFGETVFKRGAEGIGTIWGAAGVGLVFGGMIAHRFGKRLTFDRYKLITFICYVIHAAAYMIFSQMQSYAAALVFIGLSRAASAVNAVLNFSRLLQYVPDEYRGRTFATLETLTWSMMMLSMMVAGLMSSSFSPRQIGFWAGAASSSSAILWAYLLWGRNIPEPQAPESNGRPDRPIEVKESRV